MNKLDNEFFELYKDVDRFCSDKLGNKHGISEYISELEKNDHEGSSTYKSLKHLRWVRNQIAHNSNDIPFSTEEDYSELDSFFDSLKNGSDLLSSIYKSQKQIRNKTIYINTYTDENTNKEKPKFLTLIKAFLYITILFVIYYLVTK